MLTPDNRLVTESNSWSWPVEEWRPNFSRSPEKPRRFPDSHLSNPIPSRGASLIKAAAGPVLNMSAGGSARWAPQVIEIETGIFRNTDIVGDAHALPFRDGVIEAVLALNAFEHYADPRRAVQEILRVLKPGGKVFIHTAFMLPLHEQPWHFFNCTKYGLLEWFAPFETVDIRVSENFNPAYSIAWLAHELGLAVREHAGDQAAERLAQTPLSHVSGYWTNQTQRGDALWNDLLRLPQAAQEKTAAGFEYIGRKAQGPC